MSALKQKWLIFAISSGACAATNGVFAKLTTTRLTGEWAASLSSLFGLDEPSKVIEGLVRAFFFALNLIFDGVMWGLFTRALTLASSTVHVSVLNTSANFMVTALAGFVIFSERLPPLWWLGACMLIAGSLVIGRREKGKDAGGVGGLHGQSEPVIADGVELEDEEPDATMPGLERTEQEGYKDDVELSPAKERVSVDYDAGSKKP